MHRWTWTVIPSGPGLTVACTKELCALSRSRKASDSWLLAPCWGDQGWDMSLISLRGLSDFLCGLESGDCFLGVFSQASWGLGENHHFDGDAAVVSTDPMTIRGTRFRSILVNPLPGADQLFRWEDEDHGQAQSGHLYARVLPCGGGTGSS